MNEAQWKEIFGTNGLSIDLDDHIIQDIIKLLFIPDNINSGIFINNYLALMPYASKNLSPLQVQEFYGVRDKGGTTTSPSISHFLSPANRAPAFPLWFIAAYPDVLHWFHQVHNKIIKDAADKHGENNYDTADIVLSVWGMDINKAIQLDDEGHLLDKNRKHHPRSLRFLIDAYLSNTGKSLEVSATESLYEDFIKGSIVKEDTDQVKESLKNDLTDEDVDHDIASEEKTKTPLPVYLIGGLLFLASLIIIVENTRVYGDYSMHVYGDMGAIIMFLELLSRFAISSLPAIIGIGLLYQIRYAYITAIALFALPALLPFMIDDTDIGAFAPLYIFSALILFGLLRKNVRDFFK